MSTTNLDVDASAMVRPKSLSASSLMQRALFGILVLTAFISLWAWLYDANTTTVNAAPMVKSTQVAQ